MVSKITTGNQKRKSFQVEAGLDMLTLLVKPSRRQLGNSSRQLKVPKGDCWMCSVSSTDVGGVGTGLLLRPWQ